MNLVLRTNLAMPLTCDDLVTVALAFDQVVVSVDGSEETHDARRGQGSYAAVVHNLEAYTAAMSSRHSGARNAAELSLACVMRAADIQGDPGWSVRDLARRLGVRRAPVLPLPPRGTPPGNPAGGGRS